VLTGAVAVASAAYGLGSQADDGAAVARGGESRTGGPPIFMERGPGPGFQKLAKTLGVDADELAKALRDFHEQGESARRDGFATALAEALGMDAADVRKALFEVRPDRGHRHRHPAMPLRQLASALDVSRAELRTALREVRAGAENGREEHKQALAKFLADRFDLDVDEVSDALGELPRPVPPGHGGRPGPGGPGAVGLPL